MEMVDNWLPDFDMNEQTRMDKHIPLQLSEPRTAIDALSGQGEGSGITIEGSCEACLKIQ